MFKCSRSFALRELPCAALLTLAGCGGTGESAQDSASGQAASAAVLVDAITIQPQSVPNIVELPGRIQAVRTAEVRARADGIVERRLYQEGTDVPEGAPLFRIDPRDLTAQAEQASAALRRADAARNNAQRIVKRYSPLVSDRSVSALEFDQAQANMHQAEANVADARAALARARLQLSYTIVRAPIAGRVGSAQVTEGALVSASGATLMTRIEQLSPVYALFTQSSTSVLDLLEAQRSGAVDVPALANIQVRLVLANGRDYPVSGRLDFAAQTVDSTTGSQTLRAIFPNSGRLLLPGQFVRGRLFLGTLPKGILVPARAVQIAQNDASVSVVQRDSTVATRTVRLGSQVGGNWIILSGLKPGERVITDGWQKVQPGSAVRVRGGGPAAPERNR